MGMHTFFATCPLGTESLVESEIKTLGVKSIQLTRAGVEFSCTWETLYQFILETRLATAVLHPLHTFQAQTFDELYTEIEKIPWEEHFNVTDSFMVQAVSKSSLFSHTQYLALKSKDAIVDRFRRLNQRRPNVDRESPNTVVHIFAKNDSVTVSLSLTGPGFTNRGYRIQTVMAPLKENLAAALLTKANWPIENTQIIDPMCGSATFLIEGVQMALHWPANLKKDLPLHHLKSFDSAIWATVVHRAREKMMPAPHQILAIGIEKDKGAAVAAEKNVDAAGLSSCIKIIHGDFSEVTLRDVSEKNVIITNPPYGERLGEIIDILSTYKKLAQFAENVKPSKICILTNDRAMSKRFPLKAERVNSFKNGDLDVFWVQYGIDKEVDLSSEPESKTQFRNRLRKNISRLGKWATKNEVEAYRLYNADLPDYNFAIDRYKNYYVVSEFQAPKEISEEKVKSRSLDALEVLCQETKCDPKNIYSKLRTRQKEQYEKIANDDKWIRIKEHGLTFLINLSDYLDTGIFLDHRPSRKWILENSKDKVILNLFAYTGTVSVHAAAGGAKRVVSVDRSNNYLHWAEKNFKQNAIPTAPHAFIKQDCIDYLEQTTDAFDLIFIDPPTFSNSKGALDFDVQFDHVLLIEKALKRLNPDGQIIFSNNFKKFKLDEKKLQTLGCSFRDITKSTLPEDFKKLPPIHKSWILRMEKK